MHVDVMMTGKKNDRLMYLYCSMRKTTRRLLLPNYLLGGSTKIQTHSTSSTVVTLLMRFKRVETRSGLDRCTGLPHDAACAGCRPITRPPAPALSPLYNCPHGARPSCARRRNNLVRLLQVRPSGMVLRLRAEPSDPFWLGLGVQNPTRDLVR